MTTSQQKRDSNTKASRQKEMDDKLEGKTNEIYSHLTASKWKPVRVVAKILFENLIMKNNRVL